MKTTRDLSKVIGKYPPASTESRRLLYPNKMQKYGAMRLSSLTFVNYVPDSIRGYLSNFSPRNPMVKIGTKLNKADFSSVQSFFPPTYESVAELVSPILLREYIKFELEKPMKFKKTYHRLKRKDIIDVINGFNLSIYGKKFFLFEIDLEKLKCETFGNSQIISELYDESLRNIGEDRVFISLLTYAEIFTDYYRCLQVITAISWKLSFKKNGRDLGDSHRKYR